MTLRNQTSHFNLPIGCYVKEIIDNGGVFERVYKCPDGKTHYIPESLLFNIER